jgi:hypothetical protein
MEKEECVNLFIVPKDTNLESYILFYELLGKKVKKEITVSVNK